MKKQNEWNEIIFKPRQLEKCRILEEATELGETPINAIDYCKDEHYHSFLKGCDCEMIIKRNEFDDFALVNKFCKTHQVMCSKTGWELGWYRGTNSRALVRDNRTILTYSIASAMRELRDEGWSVQRLVVKFRTNQTSVYKILANKIFKKPSKNNS